MRTLAVATALTLTLSASPASAATTPYLPHPTGHEPVGVTSLSLKDTRGRIPGCRRCPTGS